MESVGFTASIASLLENAGLPTADLASSAPVKLYGARSNGTLVGVVGLELYGQAGLLRSLAVEPKKQKSGLGKALVESAESEARRAGVTHLYLLTATAEGYFSQLGYHMVQRSEAPAAIASTSQFSSLCPSSSAFMCKLLA